MVHKRMHHVGIILPDEETMRDVLEMYGLEIDYEGETPYQTRYYFTKMNPLYSESPIEFLIPRGGKLAEFNNGKGGIHHICFEVDDVEAATQEFLDKGYLMLEDPCPISGGYMKINFMRPRSSHGILVEFMELLDNEYNPAHSK